MKALLKEKIDKSISYEEYTKLMEELVENKSTTGSNKTEANVNYTALSKQRMGKWDKIIKLTDEAVEAVKSIKHKQIWLTITESWCGDAGQNIPVLNKLAEQNENIDLRLVLRDENTDLMDIFLTNGGRAIPKTIIINADTLEVEAEWGPRPKEAQDFYWEKRNAGIPYSEFSKDLHLWYAKDKGQTVQKEFVELLNGVEA